VQPDGTVTFGTRTHPADGDAGLIVSTEARAWQLSADPSVKKGFMPVALVPAPRSPFSSGSSVPAPPRRTTPRSTPPGAASRHVHNMAPATQHTESGDFANANIHAFAGTRSRTSREAARALDPALGADG